MLLLVLLCCSRPESPPCLPPGQGVLPLQYRFAVQVSHGTHSVGSTERAVSIRAVSPCPSKAKHLGLGVNR